MDHRKLVLSKERWKSECMARYTCDYPVVKCDNLTANELLHERARIVRGYYQSREFRVHCLEKIKRFATVK